MNRGFKFLFAFAVIVSILTTTLFADNSISYNGYNYDAYGLSTPSPEGYVPNFKLDGYKIGCGPLKDPEDLFVSDSGNIYITDTGNNRIVVLDKNYEFIKSIDTLEIDGKKESLISPNCTYVWGELIYIVQSDLQRVICCNDDGKVICQYLRPVSDLFSKDMNFTPTKVLVNNSGTVFVLVKNFVYGALTYTSTGEFINFYGSNKIEVNVKVLASYFWKQIMSKQQIDQMQRYVPIEYTNFDIDSDNFIYTVTNGAKKNQVCRLNTLGENVLTVYNRNIASNTSNYGDLESDRLKGVRSTNSFVDIAVDENGFINILDQNNGRIFQFDSESRLLHIFGGNSNSGYGFKNAVAVDTLGQDILVLDHDKDDIIVFSKTEYGNLVSEAVMLYNKGLYSDAKQKWTEISQQNKNLELAYDGLGKAAYEEENYKEAMKNFKLAYSRDGYSKAFEEYRSSILRKALPYIATFIVILVILYFIFKGKIKFKKKHRSLTLNVLLHTDEEIFEIKNKNKFSLSLVFIVLILFFISIIMTRQFTSFTFNYNNPLKENMWVILASFLYVFFGFGIVNWCITSLLDGKGKLREIICCVSYSVIPYIASSFITVFLSYFVTIEEGIFLSVISSIGIIWSAAVLISSLKSVHEYSFSKTILSILLTVLGVVILVFILILLIGLLQQIISFFMTIYNEIMYR